MAEAPGLIEAHELTKRFGDTVAVDHLSFTVEPGRVTGFLGPNGAGKSTTMRLILGLDRPQAGLAHINGYLPEQAGTLITHTHEQSGDLLSPWRPPPTCSSAATPEPPRFRGFGGEWYAQVVLYLVPLSKGWLSCRSPRARRAKGSSR